MHCEAGLSRWSLLERGDARCAWAFATCAVLYRETERRRSIKLDALRAKAQISCRFFVHSHFILQVSRFVYDSVSPRLDSDEPCFGGLDPSPEAESMFSSSTDSASSKVRIDLPRLMRHRFHLWMDGTRGSPVAPADL